MKIKPLIYLLAVCIAAGLLAGMVTPNSVMRVRDRKFISFDRMQQEIRKSSIVFVGEVHDMQEHHDMELAVIRAFHEADIPITVGLEMFRADSDKELEAWVNGRLTIDQFLSVYYDNWQQPWSSYRDIFLYLKEHQIPAIGLNIPDDISETIAAKGFDALTPAQKKRLPPSISCNVDPTYMAFIRKAYSGHSHRSDKQFLNFCEAQMVWDKSMAWNVIQYLNRHKGRTVIVLTGVGHAWKRGIPEQIELAEKFPMQVIMPLIPGQIEINTVSLKDADYVVLD